MKKTLVFLYCLCCALHCIGAQLFLERGYLGKIPENSQKEFSLKLKNVSDGDLFLEEINSSCACVSILDWMPYKKLESGSDVELKIRLDAGRLSPGDFAKSIYVSIRGNKKPVPLIISGVVQALFKIVPDSHVKLNPCNELNQWTRGISIQPIAKMSSDALPVLASAPSSLAVSLQKGHDGEVLLSIAPKLPLSSGIMKENLELKFPDGKCAKIRVEGSVLKPVFHFEKMQVKLSAPGQRDIVRMSVVPPRKTRHGAKSLPVDYQAALAKLTAEVPQGVEAEFTAQANAVLLTVYCKKVPAKGSVICIRYGKENIGTITISGQ